MQRSGSYSLIRRAEKSIPGGVNSPVRAFKGVGGHPIFFASGDGAWVTDVDGNRYLDYVGSWGPMILGHNHAQVVAAVQQQAARALGFGAPTELEIELAETIVQRVPGIDSVRLVNSGTEATMSAIRLARAVTGRNLIVKFDGCYHGHSDSLLIKAGSGLLTLGIPGSPGVPEVLANLTVSLPFNQLEPLTRLFQQYPDQVACVIVEPVAGNMGCVPPLPGFLEGLRTLTRQYDSLLIFDEVMTGFRVAFGGAQELFNISPDLTTLGKVVGGGLPVGAFGGRVDLMNQIAPAGPVYQAGTLSGNPLTVAAGLATLRELDRAAYCRLTATTTRLATGLQKLADQHGLHATVNSVCGMFGLFFARPPLTNFTQVANANIDRFNRFFHGMLDEGIYLAPSAFEAGFVSLAHSDADIDTTLAVADRVMGTLRD